MAFKWLKKKDGKAHGDPDKTAVGPLADAPEKTADPGISTTPETEKTEGFFGRLKKGLSKTRRYLTTDIEDLFTGGRKIDADLLDQLEELLITADIGVRTATDLIAHISGQASRIADAEALKRALRLEILRMLQAGKPVPEPGADRPHVIMVVGVNGVGKTTTIGKLATRYARDGRKVLIAAADTFRAAAMEQLTIWADRAGAEIVRHKNGSDPAAVAFDGVEAALAREVDVVLVDTAGRLHTRVNLMEELKKIQRALGKRLKGAPHETLLVLDATTGQNALAQARIFDEALGVTGIALTKLDGTAKGGIVVSICRSLALPLQYVGVGEKAEDLQRFDPESFVRALM